MVSRKNIKKFALISVYNKKNLKYLCTNLVKHNYSFISKFINLLKLSDDILLSYADKKMTGFAVCFYEKSNYSSLNYKYFLKNYSDFLYIDRIAISKNYRGIGMGSALYKKLIEK